LDDAEDKDRPLGLAYRAFDEASKKLQRGLYAAYGLLGVSWLCTFAEGYWAYETLALLWGSAAGLGYLIAKLQQREPAERKYLDDVIREWEQEVSGT